MNRFTPSDYRQMPSKTQPNSFVYEPNMQRYSPSYKSPASSKQKLNSTDINLSSDNRQKTEPTNPYVNQKNDVFIQQQMREKELLLQKAQQEIQVLKDESRNLMRLNQQYKQELQTIHEENNKKQIRIETIELQIDLLKRRQDKDRDFRSNSQKEKSPYRQQNLEEEVHQLRSENKQLLSELKNQKKILTDMNQTKKLGKSETDFRNDPYSEQSQTNSVSNRQFQQTIQSLEVEIVSMKDHHAYQEEQINILKKENKGLKEFIEGLLQKNKNHLIKINELQSENEEMTIKFKQKTAEKDQMRFNANHQQDQQMLASMKKENSQLRHDNQQILDENERLSQKLSELYLELNQKNQNDDRNTLKQQQNQIKSLQDQLQKSTDDRKRLTQTLDMLKNQITERDEIIQSMQRQKEKQTQMLQSRIEDPEMIVHHSVDDYEQNHEMESAIKMKLKFPRFLPDLGMGSHINCVLHALEKLPGFNTLIQENMGTDDTCTALQKVFDYINNKNELDISQLKDEVSFLVEMFQIDNQVENRANDYLFSVIDCLSKIILKSDQEEQSAIAKIIQQRDSPIYDLFFFLQRSLPLQEEIQANEIPLINSIKLVKFIDIPILPNNLGTYLSELIRHEGYENSNQQIKQIDSDQFNFVVFPKYLVLNVSELSSSKCYMSINTSIDSNQLTGDAIQPFKYELVSMIHCSETNGEPVYYMTLRHGDIWLQVLFEQFEEIQQPEHILTFKKTQGDKELLIYEKVFD